MKTSSLSLQPLTAESFAPFGDVIERNAAFLREINYGKTEKFADLAKVDTQDQGGRTAVHIYRSKPLTLPLAIEVMERHPLGSQAMIPLHDRPFLIVVAARGAAPEASQLKGFYSNGQQGVNYHKGVWHHYQITLHEVSEYLVIDREGPGENCDEHRLAPGLLIEQGSETP
jgi:ureidoglycolate lyase